MLKKFHFPYMHCSKNALALLALCFVISFASTSCNKNEDDKPEPSHQSYFPLETVMWREYVVDSVQYWGSTSYPNDTAHFFLREEVVSTFTDNTGALNYVIKTSYRQNESDAWMPRIVSAASRNDQRAELLYNNDRFVKLIFPAYKDQSWNANMYNDEDPDNFMKSKYIAAHTPANVNGKDFDSTLTVEIQNHEDFINTEHEEEQYANNVGLIKHTLEDIETQEDQDHPGQKLLRGFRYTKTITDYGK